jgi:hypothetical protein
MKKKYFTDEERRLSNRKRTEKFRENCPEYMIEYRLNNKENIKKTCQDYEKNNKEKIKIYRKSYGKFWRENNKEKIKKDKKEDYENNKEEYRLRSKVYNNIHKEKINQRILNRLKIDVDFKLAYYLRCRLYRAIKNNQKVGSAVKDLGCTIPELKLYLESLFKLGMTWDNWTWNGWHIDHIKPLSKFNLQDRNEFLKANHYTNLQPLWAEENISKGNKI